MFETKLVRERGIEKEGKRGIEYIERENREKDRSNNITNAI